MRRDPRAACGSGVRALRRRPSVVLDRLAVEVVEPLDPAAHAEAAPRDLLRARVPAHVVRVARAVDEHFDALRARAERVRNARTGWSHDYVAGPERRRPFDLAVG